MIKKLYFLLTALMISHRIFPSVINVPGNFATIQSAINAASHGDTVLVEPGTYFENINFRGRNIVLTSRFYIAHDTSFICSTIINGSQPAFADTASCVIFNSGEDSTAIIQGFTITGGAGTKWADVHGAGNYREGGGIITEFSSPVIRWNYIINNIVTNTTGVISTGGGGIRCGDGHPHIYNNVISNNQARYGGGVVFNYCSDAILKNNIIAHNSGGQSYGGGGIWATGANQLSIVFVENNTIANNHVSGGGAYGGKGGGIFVFTVSVRLKNNIIWGNTQTIGNSIAVFSGSVTSTYSDIDYAVPGAGNINADPLFIDTINYLLSPNSPCIDAGDSTAVYDDLIIAPSTALYPSKGTERNDMGCYGGPMTTILPTCHVIVANISDPNKDPVRVYPNPANDYLTISIVDETNYNVDIYNISGQQVYRNRIEKSARISVKELQKGMYTVRISLLNDKSFTRKLIIL